MCVCVPPPRPGSPVAEASQSGDSAVRWGAGGGTPLLRTRASRARVLRPSPSVHPACTVGHRARRCVSGRQRRAHFREGHTSSGPRDTPFPEHRLGATPASPSDRFPEGRALIVSGTGGHILSGPGDGLPARRGSEAPSLPLTGSSWGLPCPCPGGLRLLPLWASSAPSLGLLGAPSGRTLLGGAGRQLGHVHPAGSPEPALV